MKIIKRIARRYHSAKSLYAIIGTGITLFYFTMQALACSTPASPNSVKIKDGDKSVSKSVVSALATPKNELYFPLSVERFYEKNDYKLVWVAPDTIKTHVSDAMLLLDCVLHYGLSHKDYHPNDLTYDKLSELRAMASKADDPEKARFDVLLTDAMITFINNLHYGKLNPDYLAAKIDSGNTGKFSAEALLEKALQQGEFMKVIESAQPASKEYAGMQDHMRKLTGQYQADCYEVPQEDIQIMAINLERLRWINTDDQAYIQVNIPAFMLAFHLPDTVYQFKTIVGTQANPTPALQSTIGYFTTAPDWKVPQNIFVKELLPNALKDNTYLEKNHFAIYDTKGNYVQPDRFKLMMVRQSPEKYSARQSSGCDNALGLVVFRFPNVYDVYLHDTPEQQLFAKDERDLSHGCIRVEHAEKLAGLLLKNDGAANKLKDLRNAMEQYQTKTFKLKKAVPIKITYLTCEVKEGLLITYKDIYGLDKSLKAALYEEKLALTKE